MILKDDDRAQTDERSRMTVNPTDPMNSDWQTNPTQWTIDNEGQANGQCGQRRTQPSPDPGQAEEIDPDREAQTQLVWPRPRPNDPGQWQWPMTDSPGQLTKADSPVETEPGQWLNDQTKTQYWRDPMTEDPIGQPRPRPSQLTDWRPRQTDGLKTQWPINDRRWRQTIEGRDDNDSQASWNYYWRLLDPIEMTIIVISGIDPDHWLDEPRQTMTDEPSCNWNQTNWNQTVSKLKWQWRTNWPVIEPMTQCVINDPIDYWTQPIENSWKKAQLNPMTQWSQVTMIVVDRRAIDEDGQDQYWTMTMMTDRHYWWYEMTTQTKTENWRTKTKDKPNDPVNNETDEGRQWPVDDRRQWPNQWRPIEQWREVNQPNPIDDQTNWELTDS